MEIGIERDNGKVVGYKIDGEIINGLYITLEFDKVSDNCKNFGIQLETPKDGTIAQKLSKRDNLCIVTLKIDKENQVQYLVGNDMSLIELNSMPENQMPAEFRNMITQAYEMTQKNRLSDFLK
ncbi:hypothetical protein [Ichthyenterobacterium magnum]|uniref:Uncharacterized protein n=1 Tax=Ichthyenterobacterium magnum TaxID=1230530 RepID=A0A420DCR4_9FLAO|nr:hypothetical protein [Ichthyenterobacterium magnum]RKE89427.1 hypothetical protein BXY80_2776 [Ichthyenterobacterium magnum]